MSTATATAGNSSAFNPKVILAVIVAGALALLAYVVLDAFSPQLDSGNNGGAHSLSNSSDGFSALRLLAEEAGMTTLVNRSEDADILGALLVLTPEAKSSKDDMKKLIEQHRSAGPILIILPKWQSMKLENRPGWVRRLTSTRESIDKIVPTDMFDATIKYSDYAPRKGGDWSFSTSFADDGRSIRFTLPSRYTALSCDDCDDMMEIPGGGGLVAAKWSADYPIFILSDPDVLNNHGLRDKARGKAALQLIDRLAEYGEADSVVFDVTLNGFGAKKSIMRFLFEPPFLAVTLCLLLAAILAGWQAFNRFGPPARRAREIALGKSALIANGAELMKQAGKDHHGASIYARHVRDQLSSALKAPSGLDNDALNKWLDRFTPHGMKSFSQLMHEMIGAKGAEEMVRIGREMSRWRKGVLREH